MAPGDGARSEIHEVGELFEASLALVAKFDSGVWGIEFDLGDGVIEIGDLFEERIG